ncbi:MAG: glucose-6-phosphate isomerase [Peptococcia bacterium]|jgi:glucose-6-phosphate isomerase
MENGYSWERYQKHLYTNEALGLSLDYSCIHFSEEYLQEMEPRIEQAFCKMQELERGELANLDEQRMVGHYWLRNAALAPRKEISTEIGQTYEKIKEFGRAIKAGDIVSGTGQLFSRFLLIGIGGSALGPQLICDTLGVSGLQAYFLDNTDPDGIDWILHELRNHLGETLVIVISKSGGTVETRNGMLEVQNFFTAKGVDFAKQVVTITTKGSKLDQQAEAEGWLDRFYIWDWVGGRTSITSAVGLLPAILQDIDIDAFLQGARDCDETTRREEPLQNPASILALMWNYAVEKEHKKNMVVLPYRDSLQLFSRYLQQLVMESLGKEKDLENKIVQQGLTVYGNKGSTDQHAYVQQLLDGANDFFVVFIEVQQDRRVRSLFIEADITSGDYLKAFLEGTRKALLKKGRESLTLSLRELTPYTLGVLVALFERAVGLYAFLININAYHQPGVELGKKGANQYVELQRRVLQYLRSKQGIAFTPEEVAENLGLREETEFVYKLLEHLYLNKYHEVKKEKGISIFTGKYFI